ncbi:hypothetical protein N7524_010905 [Penicillium chrysogenum]|nr:hypothetical protein N7524_010905 [Penicillium chrysogenum]
MWLAAGPTARGDDALIRRKQPNLTTQYLTGNDTRRMGVQNPTSSWQELLTRDRLNDDINGQRHAAGLTDLQFQ